MLRRTFLASVAGSAVARAAARPSGVRLGIDAYSIRSLKWKAPRLIEYCAEHRLDTLQFGGLGDFESLEEPYLRKLKERAAAVKLDLEIGLGSCCATSAGYGRGNGTPAEYISTAIRAARVLSARVIKTYLGASADRRGSIPLERHIEETLKSLRSVRSLAVDSGVKVAMENHSGDLLARELVELIEAAGKDWVGCCLDTGNPMHTLEDPMVVLEILGPYTITSHLRDSVLYEHPKGAAWQWVALGDGVVDWVRFMERYAVLCPKAALLLENITGRPPRVMPYLEPEIWKAFPKHTAADFAAFVALAKRGQPLSAPMIIAEAPGTFPDEYRAALVQQQRHDLEKGLAFAKKEMGAGVNCRA